MDIKTRLILVILSFFAILMSVIAMQHRNRIDALEKKLDIVIKTQNEQLEREKTLLKNCNTFLESQKTWNEGAFVLIMETNKLARKTADVVNVMARKPPAESETISWTDLANKQMTSHDPDVTVSRDLDAIISGNLK